MKKFVQFMLGFAVLLLLTSLPLNWFFRYERTAYWLEWAGYAPSIGALLVVCSNVVLTLKFPKRNRLLVVSDDKPTKPLKEFKAAFKVLGSVLFGVGSIYYGFANMFAKSVTWKESDCSIFMAPCRRSYFQHVIEQHEISIVFSNAILAIGFGCCILYFGVCKFWRSEN